MLIFGYPLISSEEFIFIDEFQTDKKANFCIKFNENLIKNFKINQIPFSVLIQNKNEIFLSNALGAKFLLFNDKKLARFASKVAEFYLFDSKILFLVDDFKNLNQNYKLKVDGVILKSFIHNFSQFA